MTEIQAKTKTLTIGVLGLVMLALGGNVSAATARWSPLDFTPTANDGIELGRMSLEEQTMLYSASLPYFLFNGERYELTDASRITGPFLGEADGFMQVYATYEVPVESGTVRATLYYTVLDNAGADTDEAQLSSWIQFEGPRGDYNFFWRLDTDLGSRMDNRLELGAGEDFLPVTRESVIGLDQDGARLVDTRSYLEQAQIFFAPYATDNARLYAVQFHPGEAEALPGDLLNNESLTSRPSGADMVLWYETELHNAKAGLTGPDMYLVAATRVNAIIEEDKMTSAEFIDKSANVFGHAVTTASGFATGSINITDIKLDKSNVPDDSSTTNSELHSLMVANKTFEYQDSSTQWYSWVGQVLMSSSGKGVLGIMFDDGTTNTDGKPRQGCGVFYSAHKDSSWPSGDTYQAEMLLSMTHETGHVYNQHHEDFCPSKGAKASFHKGSAIMGYAFMDTNVWTFSPGSITSMSSDPEEYVRPGHGLAFTTNGSYNMTSAHSAKHASTSCKRFCCKSQ